MNRDPGDQVVGWKKKKERKKETCLLWSNIYDALHWILLLEDCWEEHYNVNVFIRRLTVIDCVPIVYLAEWMIVAQFCFWEPFRLSSFSFYSEGQLPVCPRHSLELWTWQGLEGSDGGINFAMEKSTFFFVCFQVPFHLGISCFKYEGRRVFFCCCCFVSDFFAFLSYLDFSLFSFPCDWLNETCQGIPLLGRKFHPEGLRQE